LDCDGNELHAAHKLLMVDVEILKRGFHKSNTKNRKVTTCRIGKSESVSLMLILYPHLNLWGASYAKGETTVSTNVMQLNGS